MTMHLVRSLLLGCCALLAAGCATLPPLPERSASAALLDTDDTRLGRSLSTAVAAHPGLSGIHPLERGRDAFVARALLARLAQRSLDVQYYIWHEDTTGVLLLHALWQAAERGVRVRLLLDDNGARMDEHLAALDQHQNIEVRLFNPFASRSFRAGGFLTDFDRLNRRMHNKSLTADTQATIVGGRNVGDEYYEAGEDTLFADLDVLGVGPVAREVAAAFDLYWNSESAYPATAVLPPATPATRAALQARFAEVLASAPAQRYLQALKDTPLVEQLLERKLQFEWAPVTLVYDEPVKTLGKAQAEQLLLTRLSQALGQAQREVDIVSPYFVPGSRGTELLLAYPRSGVRLRILTNSLAATDVGAVHAGYAKRRQALLAGGALLYEMKPDPAPDRSQRESGPGSSGDASLHAKTFAVDRQRLFVGSFNLDPRSVALNTEIGVVIESPALASQLSEALDAKLKIAAYEVRRVAETGQLQWIEHAGEQVVVHETEPRTGFLRRLGVGLLSLLPIDWML